MSKDEDGTVCPAKDWMLSYPEVFPGANDWLWSDADPHQRMTVTAHGLRRLLRFVSEVQREDLDRVMDGKIPSDRAERKSLTDRMNAAAAIFCEGDLVMSRLFVDAADLEIRHPHAEVDTAALDFISGKGV